MKKRLIYLCCAITCLLILLVIRYSVSLSKEFRVNSFIEKVLKNNGDVQVFRGEQYPWAEQYPYLEQDNIGFFNANRIVDLTCRDIHITELELGIIVSEKKLQNLTFINCGIDDNAISNLKDCNNIVKLCLVDNNISDRAGKYIKDMENVNYLQVTQKNLSPAILSSFSGLSVEDFDLSNTPINEKDLLHLLPLDKVRYVNLSGTRISDDVVVFFNSCPNLCSIDLCNTGVSGKFLKEMSFPGNIKNLNFASTVLTDTNLMQLQRYKNLMSMADSFCDTGLAVMFHSGARL